MLNKIKKFLHIDEPKQLSVFERIENLYSELNNETVLIKIGADLVPLSDFILEIISELRDELKEECGFILPPIKIRDNTVLQENEFVINIQGVDKENGFLIPTRNGIEEEFYETLKTVMYDYMDNIFTNEIAEKYVDTVQRTNSFLVWNLSQVFSIIDMKTIMIDIIKSGKSLNNINYVFEKIGEQVLTGRNYRDCLMQFNPHVVAKKVVEYL